MMNSERALPYVVLLGDVGTGKSTIVEKLTGERGRSSEASTSFTRTSDVFFVPDDSLIVSDTPGSNALEDKLQHNVWIACALNFMPVSRIFIVTKAEARIDTVVSNVRKYADCFLDLPMDVVSVLVTHMDTVVGWEEKDFTPKIDKELGIDTVVFSGLDTTDKTLLRDILKTCTEVHDLTIDSDNFFRFFHIHSNHRKILKCTSDEVKSFRAKKNAFDVARKSFEGKDLVDLYFEFQAYMTEEIVEAQKRISYANNFTFLGDGAADEAGHVANMVNQLRAVLYDIRNECTGFQNEHGVSELRRCPHCGLVWTKVEGCTGATECGKRPTIVNDIRDSSYAVLATFTFRWIGNKLNIFKSGNKSLKKEASTRNSVGCGKSITWSEMRPVDIPPELEEAIKVSTTDVKMLPLEATGFQEDLDKQLAAARNKMELRRRPRKKTKFRLPFKW